MASGDMGAVAEFGLPGWALVCVSCLHTACGGPSGGRVEDPGDFTLEAGLCRPPLQMSLLLVASWAI